MATAKASKATTGESGLKNLRAKLVGTSPLLMHNIQLASPFSPYSREMSRLNQEKKRVKKDDEQKIDELLWKMAEVEFKGGLYSDEKIGPFVPSAMLGASIAKAGGLEGGWGATISRSVFWGPKGFRLDYKGPRTPDELWGEKESFADQRMVTVGTSKVSRTRPKFEDWSTTIEFKFLADQIGSDMVTQLLNQAGMLVGIGDGRKLGFGRFEVGDIKIT